MPTVDSPAVVPPVPVLAVAAPTASSAAGSSPSPKAAAPAGLMQIAASPVVVPPVPILAVAALAASSAAGPSPAPKAANPAGLMPIAASPAVVPPVPVLAVAALAASSAAGPSPALKDATPAGLMPIAASSAVLPPVPVPAVAALAAVSAAGPSPAPRAAAPASLMPIAASLAVVPPVPILPVAARVASSAAAPSSAFQAAAPTGTSSTAKVTALATQLPPISVPSTSFPARQPKFKAPVVKKKHFGSPNSSTNALPNGESLFIHHGTKTMNWIPKAARFQATILLGRLIDDVVHKNTWKSWQKLMSFASVCLCGSPKSDPQSSSLASKVKQRISNFDNIWNKPDTGSNSKTKGRGKKRTEAELKKGLAKLVSKKICEGDVKGAVRVASSQDSLAPNHPETTKKLQALHPPLLTPLEDMAPSQSDQACCLVVDERGVKRAIMSFRPGSSGGPSALRPQHLKNLISQQTGEAGERLLGSLTSLANLVLQGNVPESVRPYFFGASLTALSKNNGGVRPIACGDTLRRLVAKTACHLISAEQATDLRPIQMGVATKNGTEVVVHAVRRFLFASEGKVIFKVDFANAFNAISRHCILDQVREKVPCLYSFAFSSYSQPANLFYRNEVFHSQEGVQQGDPLGPLYFSRGIHPITSGCQSELNAWYLDDGTIGGLAPTVLADCMRVKEESQVGLRLNPQKCELTVLEYDAAECSQIISEFQAEFPGVKIVDPSDLDLLGAPLCHSNIPKVLKSKIETLNRLAESIKVLDAHDAIFLLRHCLSIPKLLYTLRCTPCFLDKISLARYDAEVRNILQSVLNVKLMDHSWEQAVLPIKFGGIGVRKASDIALPAYLASTSQCRDLSREVWSGVCPEIDRVGQIAREQWNIMGLDMPEDPNIQQHWDHTNCEKILETLRHRHANDPQQLARILACTSERSGDWLNAAPLPSLGLKLSPPQLRIAVSLRLGVDMCEPHYCICGKQVDKTGVHGLSCAKSKGRLPRHSMINDLVKRGLNSAGVQATLEPAGLSLPDGKRPDGLTLIPWANGKCLTWDFTCSDTVAPSHLQVSSKRPREVANMAERLKDSKYSALKDSYSVVPIAIETLGAYGDSAWDFFKALGRKIKKETGEPRSGAFLRQAVGMAIQRGNAISVIGTMPPSKPLDEVYYVA